MGILKICLVMTCLLHIQNSAYAKALDVVSSDLASPLTTNAKYIFIPGILATSLAYFTRNNDRYTQRETFDEAQPLGDFGFLGEYIGYGVLNITYVGVNYWLAQKYNDEKALKRAEIMARASIYSSGLTMIGKLSINERRPGFPDDKNSFPSGHASGAFSFASVIAAEHGWGWGGAAYGLAGFIAVSRINDDFHYLHDVLAGITIGASFGWGVHYNAERGSRLWMTLIPVEDKGLGFALGTSF
jgi:membrane-associated phospholipid phosphatase